MPPLPDRRSRSKKQRQLKDCQKIGRSFIKTSKNFVITAENIDISVPYVVNIKNCYAACINANVFTVVLRHRGAAERIRERIALSACFRKGGCLCD